MQVPSFVFVPKPQTVRYGPELLPKNVLDAPLHSDTHPCLSEKAGGAYRIEVSREGTRIWSNDAAGKFYAEQTLRQIREQSPDTLPEMLIIDWPDYPIRGVYHDVTRGKVPTLKTLKQLADFCASLKLNQLQLYVEHTYAYEAFPEVWADTDPLTKEEILEFDGYCAERHIELVPSFSTFGHFYPFLHTERFQHLNELYRDASQEAFNWWDRMQHFTLDCQNPESIELVSTLIEEVRPLFRSRLFNICADETFDLGNGKNKELAEQLGKGRLYVDFVKQIIGIVKQNDAVPMMWGDIMRNHLELLDEYPDDTVLIDWDYSANIEETLASKLENTGRPFYTCSGSSSWNYFLPLYHKSRDNILKLAKHGHKHGACGYLVSDWGDYGHISPLTTSFPAFALAAYAAWNTSFDPSSPDAIEKEISLCVFGDDTESLFRLIREASQCSLLYWRAYSWWIHGPTVDFDASWYHQESGIANALLEQKNERHREAKSKLEKILAQISPVLKNCRYLDSTSREEILFAFQASIFFEELPIALRHFAGVEADCVSADSLASIPDRLNQLDAEWERIWNLRNKASEYYRISGILQGVRENLLAPARLK